VKVTFLDVFKTRLLDNYEFYNVLLILWQI